MLDKPVLGCQFHFILLWVTSSLMITALIIGPLQRHFIFYKLIYPAWLSQKKFMLFCAVMVDLFAICYAVMPSIVPTSGMLSVACGELQVSQIGYKITILISISCHMLAVTLIFTVLWKYYKMKNTRVFTSSNVMSKSNGAILTAMLSQSFSPFVIGVPVFTYLIDQTVFDQPFIASEHSPIAKCLNSMSYFFIRLNPITDAFFAIYFVKKYKKVFCSTVLTTQHSRQLFIFCITFICLVLLIIVMYVSFNTTGVLLPLI